MILLQLKAINMANGYTVYQRIDDTAVMRVKYFGEKVNIGPHPEVIFTEEMGDFIRTISEQMKARYGNYTYTKKGGVFTWEQ